MGQIMYKSVMTKNLKIFWMLWAILACRQLQMARQTGIVDFLQYSLSVYNSLLVTIDLYMICSWCFSSRYFQQSIERTVQPTISSLWSRQVGILGIHYKNIPKWNSWFPSKNISPVDHKRLACFPKFVI